MGLDYRSTYFSTQSLTRLHGCMQGDEWNKEGECDAFLSTLSKSMAQEYLQGVFLPQTNEI